MKQVLFTTLDDKIHIDDVSSMKYHGVIFNNGRVSFLQQTTYESGEYELLVANGINRHDCYGYNGTLHSILKDITRLNGDATVYEFDTAKELYQWLADNLKN